MGNINVLDRNLTNMIAAGEVVERPASVVKELVENAIDSGANTIVIEIKDGGKTYIRVSDNGCGMYRDDAQLCFLRHATSKISNEHDLFFIKTLGFRGEALAAISAVSKVELLTSPLGDLNGTQVHVEGGEIVRVDYVGTPKGTTVIVRDLFYNTPARMNFMKKDSTETANIVSLVNRLAIGNFDISFKLIVDSKTVLLTDNSSRFIDTLYTVFGKEISDGLMPVELEGDKISITGYVGQPKCSRSNRNYQLFYVNGRLVKSKTMTAAIDRAYHNLLMNGKYAVAVLMLTVPFEYVDVNVHPTKMEIKFANESKVFDIVYGAVKNALSNENQVNQTVSDYFKSYTPEASLFEEKTNLTDKTHIRATFGGDSFSYERLEDINTPKYIDQLPLYNDKSLKEQLTESGIYIDMSESYEDYIRKQEAEPEEDLSSFLNAQMPFKYIGEVFKTYIIVESGDSFYLIDKHAAHERILFDRIYEMYRTSEKYCQQLLTGLPVTLSPEEFDVATKYRDKLALLGYEFDNFGNNDVILRTVPNVLDENDCVDAFTEIIQIISEDRNADITEIETKNIKMISCKAAIKAGFDNNDAELKKFISDLLLKGDANYCPHGRPIVCEYSKESVEKAFKRIV